MDILTAALLGAVQGLTEFLPVSSSGHLVLVQKLLGVTAPPLLFDTMLHVGTLAAVFIALRRDILELLRKPFRRLTLLLIAATLPTVAVALIFKDLIEAAFHLGTTLGWEFLATAAVLLVSERLAASRAAGRTELDMSYGDALVVGALQGAAILPAVSRSGLTIAGALARGLDRSFAARFSFLLSIPAILGAVVFQAKDLAEGAASGGFDAAMAVGTAVAAVVGLFSVRFTMKIVREGSMRGFALYVGAVGLLVLIDQYALRLFF